MLIRDVAYEWLEFRSPNLKPQTEARYRWLIDSTIVPYVGDKSIKTFNRIAFQNFANALPNAPQAKPKRRKKKGKGYHAETAKHGYGISTVKGSLQILKAVHNWASEMGYCAKLKSYKVDWPKTYDSFNAERIAALSDAQATRLFSELTQIIEAPEPTETDRHSRRYALGVMLALRSGMRIGEVSAFDMARDFDPYEMTAKVNETVATYKTKQGAWVREITDPKTKHSQREIPLDEDVCKLLSTYAPKSGMLIPGDDYGHAVPNPRNLRNWFNKHIRDGKYQQITFHGLRHTYATRLLTQGVPEKIVAELLGHADVATTSRIYAHPDKKQKREAIAKVTW